ncbi:MAG TPA: VOC family protein [Tepidisphaeraceae bacterium]|nr:VOC family protein [Tepidisphaeraceae bacterium]
MAITKVHHHGFTVGNIERSLRFYHDLLELEVLRVSERSNLPSYDQILGFKDVKLKVALLRHPVNEFLLELFEYINPVGEQRKLSNHFVGASHIGFEVKDVDKLYQKMREVDFDAIHPPVDIVRDGHCVARGMYALDPDGISVELFEELADVVAR